MRGHDSKGRTMTKGIAIASGLAAFAGLIGYAIYRATHDPVFPGRERELVLVDYLKADAMLKSGEGWGLAPEEDHNGTPGKVYLQRWVEKAQA